MINVIASTNFNSKQNSGKDFNGEESLQEYTFRKIYELKNEKKLVQDTPPAEEISVNTQNLILLENFDWVCSFETNKILMGSAVPARFNIHAAMNAYK